MNEYHWDYVNNNNIRILEMWYGNVQVSGAMFSSYPSQFMTPITSLVPPELFQGGIVLRVDAFLEDYIVELDSGKVHVCEWTSFTKVTADNHVIFDGLRELQIGGAILLNADCSFNSVVLQDDFMNAEIPENGIGILFCGKTVRGFKGCSQEVATDNLREFLPGRKIQAVKAFRDYVGFSLKESKDVIDRVLAVMLNYRYSVHREK